MTTHLLPVGIFVQLLRETLEADPFYSDLWLEGEITDISRSAAGHTYFSLTDADGALKCVLFRGQALRLHRLPRLGDQVAAHGSLSIYPRSGTIQLVVDLIQPAGLGAASLEFVYLRQRLAAEGLFDVTRKRPLPPWPKVICVVTSPQGAAWHDVQSVAQRRYPLSTLLLSPARVQGLGAAESIVAALEAAQMDKSVDLIILARGGGAANDLSAFNDERVARAIFASRVPVVAGIGHATDTTLAEDVADRFAATPSAAAEICLPSVEHLYERLAMLRTRLAWSMAVRHNRSRTDLRSAVHRLNFYRPSAAIRRHRLDVGGAQARLGNVMDRRVRERKHEVEALAHLLAVLNPSSALHRGYVLLHRQDSGAPIFSVSQVLPGTRVSASLTDGDLSSVVDQISSRTSIPRNAP